jgi:hypothetical protein
MLPVLPKALCAVNRREGHIESLQALLWAGTKTWLLSSLFALFHKKHNDKTEVHYCSAHKCMLSSLNYGVMVNFGKPVVAMLSEFFLWICFKIIGQDTQLQ